MNETREANEKKSYYAVIPANVRYDKDLNASAKLLYGEITALCNEKGYCWASNSYFANLYNVSTRSITDWISKLIEKKYIYVKMIYEGKKIIERRLYLSNEDYESSTLLKKTSIPIEEKFDTHRRKLPNPIEENFDTPMEENFQENNTVINNTINNTVNNTLDKDIYTDKDNINIYSKDILSLNVEKDNIDNIDKISNKDKINNITVPKTTLGAGGVGRGGGAGGKRAEWREVLEYFNLKTGCKYQDTDINRKLIEIKLKVYSVEIIKKIIDFKVGEWKNTDFEKYLRPRTIFSNKIDDYYNQMLRHQEKIKKENTWYDWRKACGLE